MTTRKGNAVYYLLLVLSISLAGVSASLAAVRIINPRFVILGFGLLAGLVLLFFLMKKPEIGLPILVFLTYTRAPEVVPGVSELPSLSTVLALCLIVVIILRRIYFGEPIENWHRPAVFFGLFGLIVLISLFSVTDQASTRSGFTEFITDVIIAMTVAILLRNVKAMKMVVWSLLAAGILLGTLTTLQQVTRNFTSSYFGLSQVDIAQIVGSINDYRVVGPGLDPNSYGMYMLLLIPLAMDRIWNEHKIVPRLIALWAFAVISLTIMFTFSRGAFLSLALVCILFFVWHPPKLKTILSLAVLGGLLLPFVPALYSDRLATLLNFVQGSDEAGSSGITNIRQAALSDPSFKGRLSENLVGVQMAFDHPVFGVGYKNFETYYQSYSRLLGIDQRREGRQAHNLYLQIAAEMGIIGIIWFGALQAVVIGGLQRAKERFKMLGMDQAASFAFAFLIALMGFLFSSIFRHMTYPRYIWLFYGILLAIPHISKVELEKIRHQSQDPRTEIFHGQHG